MAKVVATQRGYFGRILREPGDVFGVPDGVTGSWFEPVGGKPAEEFDAPVALADSAPDADPPKRGRGRPKAETVAAPTAVPFADPPEPIRAPNEANALAGQTEPDWVQSGGDI